MFLDKHLKTIQKQSFLLQKKKKIKIKIKYYVQYEKIISKNVCSNNPIEDQMLKKLISNKIGFIIKSVMN